jgi:GntR family transcriptional regulator
MSPPELRNRGAGGVATKYGGPLAVSIQYPARPVAAFRRALSSINPDSPEHTYMQLADLIEAEIRAGKLRGKIRAERDLAEEYGVAYTTVRRAMAVLRERGLIKSIQGRGTFVIQPGD